MIRCIAIDDEPLALAKISEYISRTPFLELVGSYNSAFEAMELLTKGGTDLMYVDIDMPDISGLDFVKSLEIKPLIIFTTAFSEYAIDGFRVNAIDYLLKPFGYNEFLKSATRVQALASNKVLNAGNMPVEGDYLFVRSDSRINKVYLRDIIYIEGMREYVRIHLAGGKSLMPLYSLRTLEEQLPSSLFMRVHRSYIVNLAKITTVEHNRIVFEGKVYIPVSDQYKDAFNTFLNSHSLL
ncbi:MAG: LytTR family DNA-binding domain-containing protein [Bacteroidales bacterium]